MFIKLGTFSLISQFGNGNALLVFNNLNNQMLTSVTPSALPSYDISLSMDHATNIMTKGLAPASSRRRNMPSVRVLTWCKMKVPSLNLFLERKVGGIHFNLICGCCRHLKWSTPCIF